MTQMYRQYPRETDCELLIKIPPDMLEDLCLHAKANDMNVDELILQIMAGRLGRSQRAIQAARLQEAEESFDCLDTQGLTGWSKEKLAQLTRSSKRLQKFSQEASASTVFS